MKKHNINSLLKFTLVFGIVLSIVNFTSANAAVGSDCVANKPTSNNEKAMEEELKKNSNWKRSTQS
jgi:hypothetical protein